MIYSPQIVKETLLCHAIIGRSGGKELIKTVKVICEFINPLVEFSTDTVSFSVSKVCAICLLNQSIMTYL